MGGAFSTFLLRFTEYVCQFFHVHACVSKPNFHGHLLFAYHSGVSHPVHFLGGTEHSLNGLFSHTVDIFVIQVVTDVLTRFQKILPDVSHGYFLMIPAQSAL